MLNCVTSKWVVCSDGVKNICSGGMLRDVGNSLSLILGFIDILNGMHRK